MSALDILERCKRDVETELARFLPRDGEPHDFYASVWELLNRGGKRFRPSLTFLACECVGGTRENALGPAAAVELLHNMTLIHDDIEDKSELRRGKPCIHKIYGIPTAINAGDAMLIKVFEIANSSNIPLDRRHKLVSYIAKRAYDLTWGQAFEFNMWKRSDFSESDVIRLLKSKTGALTSLSVESGAIAGGATEDQLKSLGEFGETVGIAFQIVDDILNVTADEKEYGKEIGGDIREGKKTVLAAHLLSKATIGEKRTFVKFLGKSSITASEIRKIIGLYRKYDSISYAEREARTYLSNALRALECFPNTDAKKALITVAEFLVSRKF